ncbi:hypothetical protein Tco_1054357 [Tanacetum coccineum]|uniref:Uncharacterized protein n=1 Tax=Tanacetum coccineum TaxID=301880 RepID=A0ABQ5GWJ4_9ASTR
MTLCSLMTLFCFLDDPHEWRFWFLDKDISVLNLDQEAKKCTIGPSECDLAVTRISSCKTALTLLFCLRISNTFRGGALRGASCQVTRVVQGKRDVAQSALVIRGLVFKGSMHLAAAADERMGRLAHLGGEVGGGELFGEWGGATKLSVWGQRGVGGAGVVMGCEGDWGLGIEDIAG